MVKITRGGPSDGKGVLPGDVLQLVDRTEVGFRVLASLLLFLASTGFFNQIFDTAPVDQVKLLPFEQLARLLSGPINSPVTLTFARRSQQVHIC